MSKVQIACDKCSQGVMDATNPHVRGTCKCACHTSAASMSSTPRTDGAIGSAGIRYDGALAAGVVQLPDKPRVGVWYVPADYMRKMEAQLVHDADGKLVTQAVYNALVGMLQAETAASRARWLALDAERQNHAATKCELVDANAKLAEARTALEDPRKTSARLVHAVLALQRIRDWEEDDSVEYDTPGTFAGATLEKLESIGGEAGPA